MSNDGRAFRDGMPKLVVRSPNANKLKTFLRNLRMMSSLFRSIFAPV